jgi:replicative DNA helicase
MKNKADDKNRSPLDFRIPPQNIEIEQSILCTILIDEKNKDILSIRQILNPKDFYKTAHQKIFAAMLELNDKGEPINLLTLTNCLDVKGELEDVGGASYLAQLVNSIPFSQNPINHAKIIRDKAVRRVVLERSNALAKKAFNEELPLAELAAYITEMSTDIMKKATQGTGTGKLEMSFDELQSKFLTIVDTPFESINKVITGFSPRELIVIGARTGVGKTSFVLQLLRHIAIERGLPALYFGVMMDKYEVYARQVAQECEISLRKQIKGSRVVDEEQAKLRMAAQERINKAPIEYFFSDEEISTPALQTMILSAQDKFKDGIAAIFIENLQQLDWPGKRFRDKWERGDFVFKMLRVFSYQIDSPPIFISSQLRKKLEDREDKRPMLADLFSDKMESLTNLAFLLHRPSYHDQMSIKEFEKTEDNAEIIAAKGVQPITLPFKFVGGPLLWKEKEEK